MTAKDQTLPNTDVTELPLSVRLRQFAGNAVTRAILGLAMALPYEKRVPFTGWVTARLVAPLAGWDKRIRRNLAYAWPELPQAEVDRLVRAVPDNAGRSLIESYSHADLRPRLEKLTPEGPGWPEVLKAHEEKRPIFFISGHFGNYDAARMTVALHMGQIATLYRPMSNYYFNRHYVEALGSVASPIFPRGRRGLAEMMKYIRGGNALALLIDQHAGGGAALSFFGQRAFTALSATELALKFNGLVVPAYGIRQPDGLNFRIIFEDPIPHSTAEEMAQQLNDSLEAQVRQHPEQWLWFHRRWKSETGEVMS
ncbi:lysophospholipid acyltransferase family protein [Pseudooceanicola sp. C21-150M6]|uniref:lysophospholipid acyltransferase family protein n=1 Tax=Pseudooceanicola sp. C21-150M6 TaxID=3434355 RepID=UPI003D7F24CD